MRWPTLNKDGIEDVYFFGGSPGKCISYIFKIPVIFIKTRETPFFENKQNARRGLMPFFFDLIMMGDLDS